MNRHLRCYEGGNYTENQFYRFHRDTTGHSLIVQPKARPIFSNRYGGRTYRPDFFCPGCNAYFEVIASKSVGRTASLRIEAFRMTYPNINIHAVNPDGSPYHFQPVLKIKVSRRFSSELRRLRLAAGLSLRAMASRIGLCHETLRWIENPQWGYRPKIDALAKISKEFPQLFPID